MLINEWNLLNTLVFGTARELQDGSHSTADEWYTIADDLKRAYNLALAEGDRLAEEEDSKEEAK